ncbi:hypothetical protein AVEN_69208-1 [Araneus ventricosus]|uniref:Gustatory receptor n=1 Tax=Araneus ventricosus TaxID=182803 RepID=A0A4Y2TEQ2_ARAVE|nr:hypothetical protein AVEN_69208-1 [Araneus ventricosus]
MNDYSAQSEGYGLLCTFMKIYGFDFQSDACKNLLSKIAIKLFPFLLHLSQIYLIYVGAMAVYYGMLDFEIVFAYVFANFLSLPLWYSILAKKNSIRSLIIQYQKINNLQKKRPPNRNAMINFMFAFWISIPVIAAALCAAWISTDEVMKNCYGFFLPLEDNFAAVLLRFCVLLLVFTSQHIFPNSAAMICSIMYYKFSDLFSVFYEELQDLRGECINYYLMYSKMKQHSLLFRVAYQLQDATSVICFLFLCSRMALMYFTLATFMLQREGISPANAWEMMPVMVATPLSIICVTLCCWRITTKIKNCVTSLEEIQTDKALEGKIQKETFRCLESMLSKRFPLFSACNIASLDPKLNFTVFGSLFTYGLLLLSLEKQS